LADNEGILISQTEYQDFSAQILQTIDNHSDELIALSRTIHSNPEIAYQEYKASAWLTEKLEYYGFQVERKTAEIETAFLATAGQQAAPNIALLAEYDALPTIGHACGHNLMCTASLGAAIALKPLMDKLPGKLSVFGTPAEEGGGGKVFMVNRGAFKNVDAAMIFHPSSANVVSRGSLASTRVNVIFRGRASHAAAAPDKGINALDGIILTYTNANALRQHLRRDARIMGIITNGGQAANIVPDYASGHFSIRAADRKYADEVLEKFRRCAEAAALATGATLEFQVIENSRYDNMVSNEAMAAVFAEKLEKIGVELYDLNELEGERMGSTDMGNVSQVVPSIHPYLAIAPFGTSAHTYEFRECAYSDVGQRSMLNAARALALTTLDLLVKPAILAKAKQEFAEQVSKGVCKG
jgi:amidohydrolase